MKRATKIAGTMTALALMMHTPNTWAGAVVAIVKASSGALKVLGQNVVSASESKIIARLEQEVIRRAGAASKVESAVYAHNIELKAMMKSPKGDLPTPENVVFNIDGKAYPGVRFVQGENFERYAFSFSDIDGLLLRQSHYVNGEYATFNGKFKFVNQISEDGRSASSKLVGYKAENGGFIELFSKEHALELPYGVKGKILHVESNMGEGLAVDCSDGFTYNYVRGPGGRFTYKDMILNPGRLARYTVKQKELPTVIVEKEASDAVVIDALASAGAH